MLLTALQRRIKQNSILVTAEIQPFKVPGFGFFLLRRGRDETIDSVPFSAGSAHRAYLSALTISSSSNKSC